MKKSSGRIKKVPLITAAAVTASAFLSVNVIAESNMADSGIDYTEAVETINNPAAGYTSTIWYKCKPGDTPVHNPIASLVLMFIDIGEFSSGVNGVADYDLDDEFFSGIRATLENCRNNGCTVALRFRYDANGKDNPEPATYDKMLRHISQIDEDGFLRDYESIIMYVESGFVGKWGEQHGGKYTSVEDKARLLDVMLNVVPESIPVTVRTPNIFCKWAGIPTSEMGTYVAAEGSKAARVGLYNDGYMGSDTDLGTFSGPNREISVNWMKHQMLHTYYGGEFSGDLNWAQKYTNYLPVNSVQEMYDTHLSYINSNIWQLYKDYTFDSSIDRSGADNSAYYGQTVFQFMRDHIGYRFVLRDSDLSREVRQGETVSVDLKVENTGFANPIKKQDAQVILEKDGYYYIADTDIDDRKWLSTQTASEDLEIKLPADIQCGDWNVYLKLSVGNNNKLDSKRTVHFANKDIFNSSLGANYLGTVKVSKGSASSDNRFYEKSMESSADNTLYSYRDRINIDGVMSIYEWDEKFKIAENADCRLYGKTDGEYLYLCAVMPDTAKAPVYNLSFKGTDDASQFWIYYQSNGFVYFNKTDRGNTVCKYNGGVVEFKIPYEVMNISDDKFYEYMRVDIQDSANSWGVTGDIRAEKFNIKKADTARLVSMDVNTSHVVCTYDNSTVKEIPFKDVAKSTVMAMNDKQAAAFLNNSTAGEDEAFILTEAQLYAAQRILNKA